MSYPVDLQSLNQKLQQNTPGNYRLDWAVSKQSHIRFKTTTTKDTAIILNQIWAKAIAKTTGSKYYTQDKYIRLNSDFLDDTVTFTIYPNATIMLQGKSSHKWADRYIEKIYRLVQCEIEDIKHELNNENSSLLEESATEVKGICAICDEENNDEMIHCDIKSCNAWIHNKCDGLSENEAREIKPYYCSQCRSTYNLKTTTRSRDKNSVQVSSKLYTSFGISNILDEISEEKTALDDDSALQYLKTVHQSLLNMNDAEEDEELEDSAIEELKDISKTVADRFKLVIEETEKNLSLNNTNSEQSRPNQQISTPDCSNKTNATTKSNEVDCSTKTSEATKSNDDVDCKGYLSIEKKLQKSQNHNKSLNDRLQAVTKRLISTEGGLAKANREIDRLKTLLQEKDEKEAAKSNDLTAKNIEIEEYEKKQCNLKKTIDSMTQSLLNKDREIDKLYQQHGKEKEKSNEKSKEIEKLKDKLNQPNPNNHSKTALHNIEGYCEFRHVEEVSQITLKYLKIKQENEALSQQIHFDNFSKENLNSLLEKANHKIQKLQTNEKALIKRNNDLIRKIDTMNKEAYTENLSDENRDWSTIDVTQEDLNSEDKEISNYRDALVSTPKPKRKNSDSSHSSDSTNATDCAKRMNKNNKSTTGKITDMLQSLTSHLQKYFEEKSHVVPNVENWNIKNHDPHNLRQRPVCKFFTGKGCNSARCVYYHPPVTSSEIHHQSPRATPTARNIQNKKDEICWFYQRNLCRYDDNQCRYQHPHNY